MLGRVAIDACVDPVMGSHPRRLLGMEIYKGKLICYSLGNFILDGKSRSHFGRDTAIVKCYVRNKQIKKYSLILARTNTDTYQPELLSRKQGIEVVKTLEAMSEEFGTTFTFEEDEVIIGGPKPGTPEPLPAPAVLADTLMPLPYLKDGKPFERRKSLAAQDN